MSSSTSSRQRLLSLAHQRMVIATILLLACACMGGCLRMRQDFVYQGTLRGIPPYHPDTPVLATMGSFISGRTAGGERFRSYGIAHAEYVFVVIFPEPDATRRADDMNGPKAYLIHSGHLSGPDALPIDEAMAQSIPLHGHLAAADPEAEERVEADLKGGPDDAFAVQGVFERQSKLEFTLEPLAAWMMILGLAGPWHEPPADAR